MKSDPLPPSTYNPSAYAAPPAPASGAFDSRPLNQQYRSHAAPTFNPAPPFAATAKPEEPQYARFEASTKPANEDALPAMPSWSDAKTSHVEEEVYPEKQNNIEMDRLDQNGSMAGSSMAGAAVAGVPRRSPGPGRSPVQRTQTHDNYGYPAGYQNDAYVSNAPSHDPRNSPRPQDRYHGQEQGVYRGVSPVQVAAPYGAGAGYAQHQQYDDRSPTSCYEPSQDYDRRSPAPNYAQTQDYGRSSPGPNHTQEQFRRPNYSPSPVNPYGYSAPPPQEASYRNDAYTTSESTRYEPSSAAPSYPGQQTYASEPAYPGQQGYQAFNPGQGQQYSGATRKAAPGSWKEV
jgi:hypothetical protein